MTDHSSVYAEKVCTADEAVRRIRSGDRIFIGSCSSIAYRLCQALERREQELERVTVACSMYQRPGRFFQRDAREHFDFCSYFVGPAERAGIQQGHGSFTSVHLSQVDIWCRETVRPNVAFLEVSPCDENGYMSFGPSGVALGRCAVECAGTVILQVNRNAPYVYGEDNLIH